MFRSVTSLVPQLRVSCRSASNATYVAALASLKKDLKLAMLSKDDVKKTTIRGLLSSIKNKEIDSKGKDLDEFSLSELYSKLINQRSDSINEFLKNGREDLVSKERQEQEIIENYLRELPVASREEVDAKVENLLTEMRSASPDLQLKQVFGKIDWQKLSNEWKASPSTIKSSVVNHFKQNS